MISKICVNSQCAHFSVCAHGLEYAAVPADVEMIGSSIRNTKLRMKKTSVGFSVRNSWLSMPMALRESR